MTQKRILFLYHRAQVQVIFKAHMITENQQKRINLKNKTTIPALSVQRKNSFWRKVVTFFTGGGCQFKALLKVEVPNKISSFTDNVYLSALMPIFISL